MSVCYSEEPFYYQGKYLYANQWYHENFPLEWAQSHEDHTGPEHCLNCSYFGSIHGIFIGYCANCAIHVYEGARGRGFVGDGQEDSGDFPSAFDTYLEGVDLNDIMSITGSEPDEDLDDHDDAYSDMDMDMDISIMNPHFEGGYNDW